MPRIHVKGCHKGAIFAPKVPFRYRFGHVVFSAQDAPNPYSRARNRFKIREFEAKSITPQDPRRLHQKIRPAFSGPYLLVSRANECESRGLVWRCFVCPRPWRASELLSACAKAMGKLENVAPYVMSVSVLSNILSADAAMNPRKSSPFACGYRNANS